MHCQRWKLFRCGTIFHLKSLAFIKSLSRSTNPNEECTKTKLCSLSQSRARILDSMWNQTRAPLIVMAWEPRQGLKAHHEKFEPWAGLSSVVLSGPCDNSFHLFNVSEVFPGYKLGKFIFFHLKLQRHWESENVYFRDASDTFLE